MRLENLRRLKDSLDAKELNDTRGTMRRIGLMKGRMVAGGAYSTLYKSRGVRVPILQPPTLLYELMRT